MNQNILFKTFLLIILLLPAAKPQSGSSEIISKGITYKLIENTSDTLVLYVISVNLDSCDCLINTVKANNRLNSLDETSDMASDTGIIAAVNADFFKADGSVINNMISDGYIIKAVSDAPYDHEGIVYSQFAIDENKGLHIDKFSFSGLLVYGLKEISVYGINTPFRYGENILYNKIADIPDTAGQFYFLKYTSEVRDTGVYLIAGLVDVVPENMTNKDFLLVTDNNFHISDSVRLVVKFTPDFENFSMLSGGLPEIVKGGINVTGESEVLEYVSARFSNTRHPRTGIGFSADSTTVFLFAIDGRQRRSRGISLSEFAEIMISQGVHFGLNLDGGGSTTMVINGRVMNNPSDAAGERKVGSAIIIKKRTD